MSPLNDDPQRQLLECIDTIERGYEFFLAYAAQGYEDEKSSTHGGQLRESLQAMIDAVTRLDGLLTRLESEGDEEDQTGLPAFSPVVANDAANSLAALSLVEAQPRISSQLIDNLNASVHLRALLTDLFLLGEILVPGADEALAESQG